MSTRINSGKKERRQRLESRAIKRDREDRKAADAVNLAKTVGEIDLEKSKSQTESNERQTDSRNNTLMRQQKSSNQNAKDLQGLKAESASSLMDKDIAGKASLQETKGTQALSLSMLDNAEKESRQREQNTANLKQATKVQGMRGSNAIMTESMRNKTARNIAATQSQPFSYIPGEKIMAQGGGETMSPGTTFNKNTGQATTSFEGMTLAQKQALLKKRQGLK